MMILIAHHPVVVMGEEFVPPSKPNYAVLETIPASTLAQNIEFQNACKEMAGYYKDENKNPSLKKVIVMAGVNFGYLDFLYNFKCFMDRLGIKFLPLALDHQIYTYLQKSKLAPAFLLPDLPGREKVANTPSGFGGKDFNLIGCRKMEVVAAALELGYDVIFSDVDIPWLRDPINYLFYDNIDYVHSQNVPCKFKWKFNDTMEGNTGLYSVRSSPQAIRTWQLTFKSCSQTPLYDDQTMFWLILRTNPSPIAVPQALCPQLAKYGEGAKPFADITVNTDSTHIVSCPLNNCMFSASHTRDSNTFQQLVSGLRNQKEVAYTVHANWMNGRGKKKNALRTTGLWMVVQPQHLSHSFFMDLKKNPTDTQVDNVLQGQWTCKNPTSTLMNG